MISLLELVREDEDSPAAKMAKQMGLVSKGWGRWADPRTGEVTHYTKDGLLRKVSGNELEGPAMKSPKRRPKRSRRTGKPVSDKDTEPPKKDSRIVNKPTKPNPSFDELKRESSKHKFTIMTKNRIENLRNVEQSQLPSHKPNGLWFGSDKDWIEWTEGNMPQWKEDNLYSVEIDESKCAVIRDDAELKQFTRQYQRQSPWGVGYMIDWQRVSEKYSGVIIPNYLWQSRFDPEWYYTWDVGSGCVWDSSAIKKLEQISIK